ncbi:SDR family oxidoreductase [Shimwellia blattae]|uniref:Oxidoreductase YtfG n=1 Tax=Shimwellia blattae (strain ATCC 29907 / DSM 4481 / JCM 1650 / NBRC 105725 / CDC 9005-74) TaxID=630626 RepID=I2BDD4_SHIBC|nr:SDR family oxidoreductase [Shimwellia blattae]AFJ48538.1 oxidoreductase YtfG [Shimwellia blattae DSM 4481 = NBRC 105725]GAB81426.1 NAD(P)H--quinone oxidoreductase QorB [Shimwellia blattae DSM 4481 = NBRC 105725]VDY66028.1 Quinone oxidoreductase 2 [Shimwellia blattae]VEC26683.1 Quinone oxidoreductase 2 [Shimwellia blattae]
MTIAITGATGQLGRHIISQLRQHIPAGEIVALARSPEKAANSGVTVRQADYTRPATLETALQGIDTLLLISGNDLGQRTAQHANVIAAAQKNGVRRIVYTSLLRADTSPLNLAPEHVATEKLIQRSGMAYTILRNGWYTENYTASIPAALSLGAFYGSAGEGKIASATRADYAAAAVAVLTSPGHEGKTYELAGDQAYTLADLAAELSAQSGKQIPYVNIPEADYAAALVKAGLPAGFAAAIASWDSGAAQGALFDDNHQLSRLIGRTTTPLAQSIKAVL